MVVLAFDGSDSNAWNSYAICTKCKLSVLSYDPED